MAIGRTGSPALRAAEKAPRAKARIFFEVRPSGNTTSGGPTSCAARSSALSPCARPSVELRSTKTTPMRRATRPTRGQPRTCCIDRKRPSLAAISARMSR